MGVSSSTQSKAFGKGVLLEAFHQQIIPGMKLTCINTVPISCENEHEKQSINECEVS